MFNLLVGVSHADTLTRDRFLEGASDLDRARLRGTGNLLDGVKALPALAMPELGDSTAEQIAQVGHISEIDETGRYYRIVFTPNPAVDPIPSTDIVSMLARLDIRSQWSLERTRLTVHNADLYRVLLEHSQASSTVRPSRGILHFPSTPVQDDLLSVMMPFDAKYDATWQTVQEAALDQGLICHRADTIWNQNAIIDDVAGLLWSARIVVVDYTGANANVFYEAGIAHTLGKQTIPITQDIDNIPFDLRGNRAISYDTTPQGLQRLKLALTQRIQTLLGRQ